MDERDSRFSIRSLNHAPSGVIKPSTLFPECVEDWIGEDNPVRVIDVLVDDLDLTELGFGGVDPEATGRPAATKIWAGDCVGASELRGYYAR